MKHLLKTISLLFICVTVGISKMNAQKSFKGLTATVDGSKWKSSAKETTAVWDNSDGTLTITAVNGNEKLIIQLRSEGHVFTKGFTTGSYSFSWRTVLDNYSADAIYIKGDTRWKDNDHEEKSAGTVTITEITPTRVKGYFNFNLARQKFINSDKDVYFYDETNIVSITDGSFDVTITTK